MDGGSGPVRESSVRCAAFPAGRTEPASPQCELRVEVPDSIFGVWSTGFGDDDSLGLRITQLLRFSGAGPDSITLMLEPINFMDYFSPPFYFRDMVLTDMTDGTEKPLDYSFDRQRLRFLPPGPDCTVALRYRYSCDYGVQDPKEEIQHYTTTYQLPYLVDWHPSYFTAPGMTVVRWSADVPDYCLFFASAPAERKGGRYIMDPARAQEGGLNMYLADGRRCRRSEARLGPLRGLLYLNPEGRPNVDSTDAFALPVGDGTARVRERLFRGMLRGAADIFPGRDSLTVHVMDGDLMRGRVLWGNTTRMGDSEYLVLVDTSMWRGNGLCHELLHAFDRGLLGSVPHDDPEHYFFAESLIEYLSCRVTWPGRRQRDEAFGRKAALYAGSSEAADASVFGLADNRMDASAGSGSAYVIYQKTPCEIHRFARSIGEKRFMRIFRDFYRQARADGEVSLGRLRTAALRNGVTPRQWDDFAGRL